jgi:glycosyltransferase involved in cell wall biosynthesis
MSTIVFVHHGEPSPADPGYNPMRNGHLARELTARGHRVIRVLPRFPHLATEARPLGQIETDDEGGVLHVDTVAYTRSRGLGRVRFVRSFRRQVERLPDHIAEPDVIMAALFPGVGAAVRRMLRARGWCSTVVIDIRDIWPDAQMATAGRLARPLLGLWAPFARRSSRRELEAADALVAVSDEYLDWAVERSSAASFLPRRAFPIGSAPMDTAAERDPACAGRAVFVGSVNSHFDFESLIQAWELLLSTWDGAITPSLTIVGDGSSLERLKQRCAAVPLVSFSGRLTRHDAFQVMSQATVGLAPYHASSKMTSTNKVAEYLAHGLGVVTTRRSELAEELSGRGCLDIVDPRDVTAYARVLAERMQQPRSVLAPAALLAHRALLSSASVSTAFADFLESVVPGHAAGPAERQP